MRLWASSVQYSIDTGHVNTDKSISLLSIIQRPKSEQNFDQHYFLGKVLFHIYMPWVKFVWVKMVKYIDISQQVFVSSKVKKCSLTLQVHNLHIYVCKSTCRRSVCTYNIFMCVHVYMYMYYIYIYHIMTSTSYCGHLYLYHSIPTLKEICTLISFFNLLRITQFHNVQFVKHHFITDWNKY